MRKYTIEEIVKGRRWYVEFKDRNQLGEKILVEFSYCENSGSVHSLPNMWYKSGRIDRVLENYWSISTFATDENGTCRGRYHNRNNIAAGHNSGCTAACRAADVHSHWYV